MARRKTDAVSKSKVKSERSASSRKRRSSAQSSEEERLLKHQVEFKNPEVLLKGIRFYRYSQPLIELHIDGRLYKTFWFIDKAVEEALKHTVVEKIKFDKRAMLSTHFSVPLSMCKETVREILEEVQSKVPLDERKAWLNELED